jgi:hypothetical protein
VDKSITDFKSIPRTCGLLTVENWLSRNCQPLLAKLHCGALTSVEVTEAFCGRADWPSARV